MMRAIALPCFQSGRLTTSCISELKSVVNWKRRSCLDGQEPLQCGMCSPAGDQKTLDVPSLVKALCSTCGVGTPVHMQLSQLHVSDCSSA